MGRMLSGPCIGNLPDRGAPGSALPVGKFLSVFSCSLQVGAYAGGMPVSDRISGLPFFFGDIVSMRSFMFPGRHLLRLRGTFGGENLLSVLWRNLRPGIRRLTVFPVPLCRRHLVLVMPLFRPLPD